MTSFQHLLNILIWKLKYDANLTTVIFVSSRHVRRFYRLQFFSFCVGAAARIHLRVLYDFKTSFILLSSCIITNFPVYSRVSSGLRIRFSQIFEKHSFLINTHRDKNCNMMQSSGATLYQCSTHPKKLSERYRL